MEPVSIIINKDAYGGTAWRRWKSLARQLRERNIPFEEHFVDGNGDGRNRVRLVIQSNTDLIAIAGGDGTLNEVINQMATEFCPTRRPITVIPLGRGNDFARTLKLTKKAEEISKVFLNGHESFVDLGMIRSSFGNESSAHYFSMIAGGGAVAQIAATARGPLSRCPAQLAYGLSLVKAAIKTHYWNVRIKIPNRPHQEINQKLAGLLICNVPYIAGGLKMFDHNSMTDGLMELILIPELNPIEKARGIFNLFSGRGVINPKLTRLRIQEAEITSDAPFPFQVDGEIIGTTPVHFKVIPKALKVLT